MSGLIRDTRNQPGLEVAPPPVPQVMEYYQAEIKAPPLYSNQVPSISPPHTCGLVTRTFWIVFVVVLVIIGAAVGGGVGGGLAAAHKNKNVSIPPQQQSTSFVSSSSSMSLTSSSSLTMTSPSAATSSSSLAATSSSSLAVTSSSSSAATSSSSSSSTSTGIPPSSTDPGTYRIINIATNTALDLLHGGTTNDTTIECWQWNPYATPTEYAHQAWQIASVGGNAIIILNTQTNSYITAPNNLTAGVNPSTNSADAAVYGGVPGSPTDPHAQWAMVTNSDNSVSFVSKAYPSKLLDLGGSLTINGAPVLLWEKNGGLNQDWRLVPS